MTPRLRKNAPILLLLTVLIAITSVATYLELRSEVEYSPLSTMSNAPDGARALYLWMEALDYTVRAERQSAFVVPDDAGVGFVLEPQIPGVSTEEWQGVEEWVESGNVLFIVGEGFGAALTMQMVGFNLLYRDSMDGRVQAVDDRFLEGEPATLENLRPRAVLESDEAGFTPLLTVDDEVLAVAVPRGDGLIVMSTLAYPFTNRGLKDAGNADFVINMLAQSEAEGVVWFDEWHHGLRGAAADAGGGLSHWLRSSRQGHAILYIGAVIFLWLLLSGRRFGQPIPLKGGSMPRAAMEHVSALARLSKKAEHLPALQDYFRHELKIQIGRRAGLSPDLPDEEFARRLTIVRPDLDGAHVKSLLQSLREERLREEQLLELVQETGDWTT